VITIVFLSVLILIFTGFFLFTYFLSRKKIVAKELEKKNKEITYQKEITESIIINHEKERKRISEDLHDNISSKLNVINLNVNLLKDGNLNTEESLVINNASTIAHNLLPPILEKFGFKDAVEELADAYNNSRKINISYTINYQKKLLIPENELHLFRIIEELIKNSVRCRKANNSIINIAYKENKLIFNYTDNGIDFNTDNINNKKGLGMKNIESRISLLNAQYSIENKIGNGFKIIIVI
jgi:signal transduction histidine kinase